MIKQNKYHNKFLGIIVLTLLYVSCSKSLFAQDDKNFKEVEATGRAVLIDGKLEISRKRALEDALYLAALKGGADINGFSAITSNTIINDQSIISATNRVIDFNILEEIQDKEFLSVKIKAIVGGKLSTKNCKVRPINVTLFKGNYEVHTNIPSNLSRKVSQWYSSIYDIINQLPNLNATINNNTSLKPIIKSSINPSYDYNAVTNELPVIQAGDYSLVPKFILTESNQQDSAYTHYLLKVSLKVYKGHKFKLMPFKSYDLPIEYQLKTKFQFIKNISTSNIDFVDNKVNEHLVYIANDFLNQLNCRPLEGSLTFVKGQLQVDLGSNQGIKQKQIGVVKGLNIKNSMLSNSSVILHASQIFENHSILLPLNNNLKLNTLDKFIVEFTE